MAMDPTTGGCPETDFFVGHIDALFPITHHLSCGDSHAALMGVGWAWASQVDNRCNGNGPRHRFGLAKNVQTVLGPCRGWRGVVGSPLIEVGTCTILTGVGVARQKKSRGRISSAGLSDQSRWTERWRFDVCERRVRTRRVVWHHTQWQGMPNSRNVRRMLGVDVTAKCEDSSDEVGPNAVMAGGLAMQITTVHATTSCRGECRECRWGGVEVLFWKVLWKGLEGVVEGLFWKVLCRSKAASTALRTMAATPKPWQELRPPQHLAFRAPPSTTITADTVPCTHALHTCLNLLHPSPLHLLTRSPAYNIGQLGPRLNIRLHLPPYIRPLLKSIRKPDELSLRPVLPSERQPKRSIRSCRVESPTVVRFYGRVGWERSQRYGDDGRPDDGRDT
jgi:hypothetical protein